MITLFRALPWIGQLGIALALLVSLTGGYAYWHHTVYTRGYDAAIAAVAAENQEAVDAANKLKASLRNCIAAGGTWDQSGGVCRQ